MPQYRFSDSVRLSRIGALALALLAGTLAGCVGFCGQDYKWNRSAAWDQPGFYEALPGPPTQVLIGYYDSPPLPGQGSRAPAAGIVGHLRWYPPEYAGLEIVFWAPANLSRADPARIQLGGPKELAGEDVHTLVLTFVQQVARPNATVINEVANEAVDSYNRCKVGCPTGAAFATDWVSVPGPFRIADLVASLGAPVEIDHQAGVGRVEAHYANGWQIRWTETHHSIERRTPSLLTNIDVSPYDRVIARVTAIGPTESRQVVDAALFDSEVRLAIGNFTVLADGRLVSEQGPCRGL